MSNKISSPRELGRRQKRSVMEDLRISRDKRTAEIPDTLVNTYTLEKQQSPSITTLKNSNFVITWDSRPQDGSGWGVYAQIFSSNGKMIGPEFQVNTHTNDNQGSPTVASIDNGNFIIAWNSANQDGSSTGVYAQMFDSNGQKIRSEFQVNIYTNNRQEYNSVSPLKNGNFIVNWSSFGQDGSKFGVYAQVFDKNGNRIGPEFRVNTRTGNYEMYSRSASLSNGKFVITWQSLDQDGSSWGIYAQMFDRNSNKIGSEFRVNTYTASGQVDSEITALSNGGFLVNWASEGQDGSGIGIYAQTFNEDGRKIGSEFRVNTYTIGNQGYRTKNSSFKNANFIVTWYSEHLDGSGWGVYAQIFDKDRKKIGNEFRVNTYTDGHQWLPSITSLADDGFVITWQGQKQNSADYDIYMQMFNSQGRKIAPGQVITTPQPTIKSTTEQKSTATQLATTTCKSIRADVPCSAAPPNSGILLQARDLISNFLHNTGQKIGLIKTPEQKEISEFNKEVVNYVKPLKQGINDLSIEKNIKYGVSITNSSNPDTKVCCSSVDKALGGLNTNLVT